MRGAIRGTSATHIWLHVVDRENLFLYVVHVGVRLVNCVLCAQKFSGCGATIEIF